MNLDFLHYSIGPSRISDATLVHLQFTVDAIDEELLRREAETWPAQLEATVRNIGITMPAGRLTPEPGDSPLAGLGRALAVLCIDMQNQAGHVVSQVFVRHEPERQRLHAYFEHDMTQFGEQAALLAMMLANQAMPGLKLPVDAAAGGIQLDTQWRFMRSEFAKFRMPGDTRALVAAADREGIPVAKLERTPYEPPTGEIRLRPNSMLMLGQGGMRHLLDGNLPLERNPNAVLLVKDAEASGQVLVRHEIPQVDDNDTHGSLYHLVVANGEVALVWDVAAGAEFAGEVAPELATKAILVAHDLDLGLLQLSVRSPDPRLPLEANGGGATALAVSPELDRFLDPDGEPMQRVMTAFMTWLCPEGENSRLDTIAVTGRAEAAGVAERTAQLLEALGKRTGLVNARGRAFQGEWEDTSVEGSVMGHYRLFENALAEAIVMEANPLGTAVNGYAFNWCHVAVCSGSAGWQSEQPWLDSQADFLALQAGLLVRAKRGVVLNMDDPHMGELAAGMNSPICRISAATSPALPADGASSTWQAHDGDQWLALNEGENTHWIAQKTAADDEAPLALPAAVAACFLLGVSPGDIVAALAAEHANSES